MRSDTIIQQPELEWFRKRPREAYVLSTRKARKPILDPISKLGGFPFLGKRDKWPSCPRCAMSLFFVGQFGSDFEPLPLPEGVNLLTVFKCSNMDCDAWSETISGAPYFRLIDTSAVVERQSPEADWDGKGIYPPPGIQFDKHGPANISIAAEVGLPFHTQLEKRVTDYPGWEECPSWRKLSNDALLPYMEIRPIDGNKLLGHPKWVQSPDYPRCNCGRKMKQLVQLDAPQVNLGDSGRMHIYYCERWCREERSLAALWQCH